jgi:hypothetical protein
MMSYTPPAFDAKLNMHNRRKRLAPQLEPFFNATAFAANPTSGWSIRDNGFLFASPDKLADALFYRAMTDVKKEPDAVSRYDAMRRGKVAVSGRVMGYAVDVKMITPSSYEMVMYVQPSSTITIRRRPDTAEDGRYSLSFVTGSPQVVPSSTAMFLWKVAGIGFSDNKYWFDRLVRTRTFTFQHPAEKTPFHGYGGMCYDIVEQPNGAPQVTVVSVNGIPETTFTPDKSKNKQLKEYLQAAMAIIETFTTLTDLTVVRPGEMRWGFEDVPSKLMNMQLKGMSLEDFCQAVSASLVTKPFGAICVPSRTQLKHMIRLAIDGYKED